MMNAKRRQSLVAPSKWQKEVQRTIAISAYDKIYSSKCDEALPAALVVVHLGNQLSFLASSTRIRNSLYGIRNRRLNFL